MSTKRSLPWLVLLGLAIAMGSCGSEREAGAGDGDVPIDTVGPDTTPRADTVAPDTTPGGED